jgi:predicted RNA binding protein YcfA (HicA-like mRNA interferase family)
MPKKWIDSPYKRQLIIKFLEQIGLELIRCTGDHFIYNRKPKLKRPLILVLIDPVPKQYIRKLLKAIDVTEQDFLDIIEEI